MVNLPLHIGCRWCHKDEILNGSGRCEACELHYQEHSVRYGIRTVSKNFRKDEKLGLFNF